MSNLDLMESVFGKADDRFLSECDAAQSADIFADDMDNIVEKQRRVEQLYFDKGRPPAPARRFSRCDTSCATGTSSGRESRAYLNPLRGPIGIQPAAYSSHVPDFTK